MTAAALLMSRRTLANGVASAAMNHATGTEVWGSAAWREQAVSWLDEQLAGVAIERTGEVEQPHLRPWATALRAPTTDGTVWLKAAGPGTAFEVGLYELLERVAPEHVLTPIAIDVGRGWIVLPDGGRPLGEALSGDELADALVTVLPQYGQLQRDLASHADHLLALGLADMRATVMPRRFAEALQVVGEYVERRGEPADREAYRRVAALGETVAAWSDELAAAPGPPSIDHNDLHPWNVFTDAGDGPGRARFYDWGDSVVAHPFASMLVALGFVQFHVLEAGPGDARLLRLRDAYLEVFSDLAPHGELVDALELACRVGKVARALTWNRAISALGPDEVEDRWASAPLESMASLLDDSYLGGA
jgi:Phosphotransferase enzyme family